MNSGKTKMSPLHHHSVANLTKFQGAARSRYFENDTRFIVYQVNLPSTIVMVKEQLSWFPDKSVYVYVTTVLPVWKKLPGAADRDTKRTTPDASAVLGSLKSTVVPPKPNSIVCRISCGQVTIGGSISTGFVSRKIQNGRLVYYSSTKHKYNGHITWGL